MHKKFFIIAFLWTCFIIVTSLISIQSDVKLFKFSGTDKIVHALYYFIFVILWVMVFKNITKKVIFVVFLTSVLLGTIIEVLQHMMNNNRMGDVYDVLSNTIGAFIATLFFIKSRKN